jgi:hypothetical protein
MRALMLKGIFEGATGVLYECGLRGVTICLYIVCLFGVAVGSDCIPSNVGIT